MSIPAPITLAKEIAAFQLKGPNDGQFRGGPLCRIPKGAELTICGDGFNQRTATVRCNGQLYFVFLRDIDDSEEE